MNPDSNDVLDSQSSAAMSPTRPMLWSVQREIWENRYVYLAPLVVASVVVFASLMNIVSTLPRRMRGMATMPGHPSEMHVTAFHMAPAPIMLATFVVGFFYCLDALYGERRDRSILFWKSLPVSDRTTVISKASIPMIVLPLIAYVLSVATQMILILGSIGVVVGHGFSFSPVWGGLHFFSGLVIMFYGLAVHALWFAPIYAWLLLVSVWAKRAPFLWAVLPPLALVAVERIAFNGSSFLSLLRDRVTGAMAAAFAAGTNGNISRLSQLEPLNFLRTPGLWVGLAFAVAFLVAAVHLRRSREPV